MTTLSDQTILQKYNEAFIKYGQEAIIDLDAKQLPPLNFAVYPLEDRLKEIGGVVPTNRESNYYIAYIKRGSGLKTIGLSRFPIVDHTLMVIPARTIHGGRYTSTDYQGFVMGFSLEFFTDNHFPRHLITNKLIFERSLRPYMVLDGNEGQMIEELFKGLLRESGNNEHPATSQEMIALKVLELIITCDRLFSEKQELNGSSIYPANIERFNDLLEKNFSAERSVTYYAEALNMHPNTLNTLIRKHTGNSVKELINNRIAMEARYYLTHSSMPVKEIAHLLGFDDPNYFSYFFRKQWNYSPTSVERPENLSLAENNVL